MIKRTTKQQDIVIMYYVISSRYMYEKYISIVEVTEKPLFTYSKRGQFDSYSQRATVEFLMSVLDLYECRAIQIKLKGNKK